MTAPSRRFAEDFAARARLSPRAPAILSAAADRSWTYADLDDLTARIAASLAAGGWDRSQAVASLLPNCVEQLALFLAVLRGGGRFAPLSPLLRLPEVSALRGLLGAGICVLPGHAEPALLAGLREAGARTLVVPTDGSFSWLGEARADGAPPDSPSGSLCVATSGSTGDPKWLLLDGDALWAAGADFAGVHPFLDSGARFYNVLPMSYLGGLFNLGLIPLAAGGSVVLSEAFSGASLLGFWADVERFGVNVLWLAPTLLKGLLALRPRMEEAALAAVRRQVRACLLGMAPCELGAKRAFEDAFGIPVLENYALSETTFLTSETLESRARRTEGSVGEALAWVRLRSSASGELEAATPYLCRGALSSAGTGDPAVDEDGFLRTGDLGRLEAPGGPWVITGRTRDIVKKGGYLVSLRELEILAGRHPSVAEAAAVGVPDPFYGEDVVLFVRWRDAAAPAGGEEAGLAGLRAWMSRELARFKWPSRILAVDEFPRTASGKVLKHGLRDRLREAGAAAGLRF